ncbi:MAG: hypothetical protein IJC52_03140, partial [Clostridia bacterium]|nr:hypothetical protein [Clostridia bacterium]
TTTTTTTTKAPVAVCGGINLLDSSKIWGKTNVTVTERAAGGWEIKSTDVGGVNFNGCGTYDAATYQYVHVVLKSDVPFIFAMYDAANNKWMNSNGDFYPQFGCGAGEAAPAGTYELSLWTNGCYTWDGSALPATVQISDIAIEPQGAGTITITHLEVSANATCPVKYVGDDVTTTTSKIDESTTTTIVDNEMMGDKVTFTVSNVTAKAGDTVTIDLSVSENHYMVNGQFRVVYDPTKLEIQEVGSDPDNPYFDDYNTDIFKNTYMWAHAVPAPGYSNFAFAGGSAQGTTAGGVMYSLTFKVLDGWTGEAPIELRIPELSSNDGTTNGGADYHTNRDFYVFGGVTVN